VAFEAVTGWKKFASVPTLLRAEAFVRLFLQMVE
jgi:hypothetical protein